MLCIPIFYYPNLNFLIIPEKRNFAKKLENIIKNPEALAAIRDYQTLDQAFELSRPKNKIFEENLYSAQRNVQKAWSFVIEGYDGNEELLNTSRKLAD
ncbi:MAG: hypothetical protein DRJ07_18575, partial [Bacteroidetes bacterium]